MARELEVKFLISDLQALQDKLEDLGAMLRQPRTFELNLRFDTPDGKIAHAKQVLRLRKDRLSWLAFKGPSQDEESARLRQELEFSVSDFEAARALLEALGYQVSIVYEKYRALYELDDLEISLDELPYGSFVEIEGPEAGKIQALADRLSLDWGARLPASYTSLFKEMQESLELPFRDLTYENFEGTDASLAALGYRLADLPE